ncbi:hypothetical protein BGS_1068 [Beggiatoa sp. SS]|nr:hypothetical protein BGS_1068 [Beggiatoa sp. SS]
MRESLFSLFSLFSVYIDINRQNNDNQSSMIGENVDTRS